MTTFNSEYPGVRVFCENGMEREYPGMKPRLLEQGSLTVVREESDDGRLVRTVVAFFPFGKWIGYEELERPEERANALREAYARFGNAT